MALTATIYRVSVELAHIDRGVYETLDLRLARHPSETLDYMATRLLAYCLEYTEGIVLTDGVSSRRRAGDPRARSHRQAHGVDRDRPAVVGTAASRPQAGGARRRLHPPRHHAGAGELNGHGIHRAADIPVVELDRAFVTALAESLDRRSTMSLSVTEGTLYVELDGRHLESQLVTHRHGAMTFPVYIPIGPWQIHPHLFFETLSYFIGFRVYLALRRRAGDTVIVPVPLGDAVVRRRRRRARRAAAGVAGQPRGDLRPAERAARRQDDRRRPDRRPDRRGAGEAGDGHPPLDRRSLRTGPGRRHRHRPHRLPADRRRRRHVRHADVAALGHGPRRRRPRVTRRSSTRSSCWPRWSCRCGAWPVGRWPSPLSGQRQRRRRVREPSARRAQAVACAKATPSRPSWSATWACGSWSTS